MIEHAVAADTADSATAGSHSMWDDLSAASSSEAPNQPVPETPAAPEIPMLARHAALHFGLLLLAFTLWAAADTWLIVTDLGLATLLAVVTGTIAGVTVNTVIHEWAHFAGARLSGAACNIPDKLGVFIYEFQFDKNSVEQFFTMSGAGQAGSAVAVLGLLIAVPLDNPGRVMLVAAALGAAVFGAMIEWPVIRRTRISRDPFAELSKIDLSVLRRSALTGVGTALALFLLVG